MNLKTAERLRYYRKKYNYSQEELAEKIGVSRQAVSKWERGEASPDTDNLIALAEIYQISLDELIKGSAAPREEPSTPNTDHVSFDGGIHVNAKNGDQVHVAWDGIHVDTPDAHVHIDKNGISVEDGASGHIFAPEETTATHRFLKHFPYPIVTVMAYILFGVLDIFGGWAFGWLIFLTIPLYYTLIDAVFKKNATHFAYPVLVVMIYLKYGFSHSLWHPLWILFLTIPLYYFLCEFIKKLIRH